MPNYGSWSWNHNGGGSQKWDKSIKYTIKNYTWYWHHKKSKWVYHDNTQDQSEEKPSEGQDPKPNTKETKGSEKSEANEQARTYKQTLLSYLGVPAGVPVPPFSGRWAFWWDRGPRPRPAGPARPSRERLCPPSFRPGGTPQKTTGTS